MEAIKPDSALAAMLFSHGGNIAAARRLFPSAPQPWVDLSTGVNPFAYPVASVTTRAFTALPQPAELASLEAAAAKAWHVEDAGSIVAAPGTQTILQHLPHVLPARTIGVLGHTYAGHADAWRNAGRDVIRVENPDELEKFEVAVVVNPNNPDGRLVSLRALTHIGAKLRASGGILVVDEAFIEASAGAHSLAPFVKTCGALVLRSFGKIYGLAGLRLGFAIAPADLAEQLRLAIGAWPVSGPAIEIAERALADPDWIADTQVRLNGECARLDAVLRAAGFEIIGGTLLFRLARHANAPQKFARLAALGVLARPFADQLDSLRFGLPGNAEQWARLASALA